MPVQWHGEQHRYRTEKKRNVVSAYFICIIADSCDCQKSDDENGGDENRVQERVAPLVADGNADFKSDNGKNNSEHGALLALRFLAEKLNCPTRSRHRHDCKDDAKNQ